jgi:hypothetical protein
MRHNRVWCKLNACRLNRLARIRRRYNRYELDLCEFLHHNQIYFLVQKLRS